MKISGFTFVRNAGKLYYPVKESIMSILPIVDEFVVALGDNDPDDTTEKEILSINSPKIKIVRTVWDIEKYPRGTENAHQTDIAKEHCSGDWLFYLQADEVVHEQDLDFIKSMCEKYLDDKRVDGFLFKYYHFWGDFDHVIESHGWTPYEIRIIRNDPDIHSYISAQSFRRIPGFDGKDYRTKKNVSKLNVVMLDAYIYHYGWARPPRVMQTKRKALDTIHFGKKRTEETYQRRDPVFDYGNLSKLKKFTGTHPAVMKDWISRFDWADQLHYEKDYKPTREPVKHEMLKSKVLTWIEKTFFGMPNRFGIINWNKIITYEKKN